MRPAHPRICPICRRKLLGRIALDQHFRDVHGTIRQAVIRKYGPITILPPEDVDDRIPS